MKPFTLIAVTLVTLALIAYTVGTVSQQRSRRITAGELDAPGLEELGVELLERALHLRRRPDGP